MYRSDCPLTNILDIIGDKWTLIIIRDLFLKRTTFKEFLMSPEKIASNILSNRLKLLQNHNFISFTYLHGNRKIKHYFLTERGIDLYPSMLEMMMWSKRNLNKKFTPSTEEWLIRIQRKTHKAINKEAINNYRIFKEKILQNRSEEAVVSA